MNDNIREKIYRERLHYYRLQDAEAQYYTYIGMGPDYLPCDEDIQHFINDYGFDYTEAVDPDSENYLLERFVSEYEYLFDCNVAENDTWQEAIRFVLNSINK